MLLELRVKNFAIIDSLSLQFGLGLNILSGETGAGKSVLLKSLALLMGEKALADTVRTGAEQASIEGFFDLSSREDIQGELTDLGVDPSEDQLVVKRVVSAQGKSRVYLNGSLCPLSTLRQIVSPLITVTGHSAPLIEMTGQHDNRNLQSKAYHLDLLDRYAGSWALRLEFEQKFQLWFKKKADLVHLEESSRNRAQRLDFLAFQRDEIEALNPQPGEDEEIQKRLHFLKNASKVAEFTSQVELGLYGDDDAVLVRLHQILQKSAEIGDLDSGLKPIFDSLQQAKTLIEDSVYEVRNYSKTLDLDGSELESLEERYTQLRRMQKKYGGSLAEILEALKNIKQEIYDLEGADENILQTKKDISVLERELNQRAEELHVRRSNGAELLGKSVNEELQDLNMKGVQFVVQAIELSDLNQHGASDVEFMIQTGTKDPLRPIAKYASGGELSRILLSLKRVIGLSDQPRTYLFDEVDTGVSGPTAEKVGKKLKAIAKGQQVVCVTHLPQVAAFADQHYLIEKKIEKNRVEMSVVRLKKQEQIKEIARLISGEKITQTSLDHARELLEAH